MGVVNRSPNMYTLIGLGVAVAFIYSCMATFAPQAFPGEMRDEHGMVGVYFEVASAIVALVLLGEWLELRARGRTSAAIRQLLELAPKTAHRVSDDGTDGMCRLDTYKRAIVCACGQARKFRWMGASSTEARASMSRC
jgi:P-type Cu+ transporter